MRHGSLHPPGARQAYRSDAFVDLFPVAFLVPVVRDPRRFEDNAHCARVHDDAYMHDKRTGGLPASQPVFPSHRFASGG